MAHQYREAGGPWNAYLGVGLTCPATALLITLQIFRLIQPHPEGVALLFSIFLSPPRTPAPPITSNSLAIYLYSKVPFMVTSPLMSPKLPHPDHPVHHRLPPFL